MTDANAPGWPGIPPRWTSSAKSGVGTALSGESRVWFTLSHGILNEVYFPRVDKACIRDLGFIVTDGSSFFSEERRSTRSQVSYFAAGVPAYRLVNTCVEGRYRIEKEVLTDPRRHVVLQRIRFTAWAHAEHIKLLRSLRDGGIFDQPPQPAERYILHKRVSPYAVWRLNNKLRSLEVGKKLRIELLSPAVVHWTTTGWQTAEDTPTRDTGLGMYTVDLATQTLPPESAVEFTFLSPDTNRWQGTNFRVLVR